MSAEERAAEIIEALMDQPGTSWRAAHDLAAAGLLVDESAAQVREAAQLVVDANHFGAGLALAIANLRRIIERTS
jgi:hypothetical protein